MLPRSTVPLLVILILSLAGCFFAGPSFNAKQEGQLSCNESLKDNESIIIQGDQCVVDNLSSKGKNIKVLSATDIRTVSFPSPSAQQQEIREGHEFSPKDTDLPILEFLKNDEAVEAIKEYKIRYIVFIGSSYHREPGAKPWSAESYKDALIGQYLDEVATYTALVVDAQKDLISGSLLQKSEGTRIMIPLLLTFSDADPSASACRAIASELLKMLKGHCEGTSP